GPVRMNSPIANANRPTIRAKKAAAFNMGCGRPSELRFRRARSPELVDLTLSAMTASQGISSAQFPRTVPAFAAAEQRDRHDSGSECPWALVQLVAADGGPISLSATSCHGETVTA